MLERFIAEFSKELGIEKELKPSAPGVYVVPVDEQLTMEVSATGRGYCLRCSAAAAPTQKQEDFFTQMLLANLFGQGTMGSILGLNEEGNKIIVTNILEQDINYHTFRDAVEDFMNCVDFWREEVLNYN